MALPTIMSVSITEYCLLKIFAFLETCRFRVLSGVRHVLRLRLPSEPELCIVFAMSENVVSVILHYKFFC